MALGLTSRDTCCLIHVVTQHFLLIKNQNIMTKKEIVKQLKQIIAQEKKDRKEKKAMKMESKEENE